MVKRNNPFPMPFHPSGGRKSDQLTQVEDTNKSTHGSDGDYAGGQMGSTPHLVQQSPEAANEPAGPALGLGPPNVEDAYGPNVSTHGLIHQPGEDAYEPVVEAAHGLEENKVQPTHDLVHQVADVDSFSDASQRDADSIYVDQELDDEPKQHVKPFPFGGLHLNSQDKGHGDSTPMSSIEQKILMFNRPENYLKRKWSPCVVSPASNRSSNPAQIKYEPVKLSPVNAMSGFHWDSENRQHQQWRVSSQKQSPPAEMNAHMVNSQVDSRNPLPGENPQVQGHLTTTHSLPHQNLQQLGFVSANQSLPQAQMAHCTMQSLGQYGKVANNQVYIQVYNQIEDYFRHQHNQHRQGANLQNQSTNIEAGSERGKAKVSGRGNGRGRGTGSGNGRGRGTGSGNGRGRGNGRASSSTPTSMLRLPPKSTKGNSEYAAF